MRIAILDDYQHLSSALADWDGLGGQPSVDVFDRNLSIAEAKTALQPYNVVCMMRERMAFPAELIDALPNLRMIAITGRQHRTLDMAAAARRGIVVSYTATEGGVAWDAAELAWALVMAVARRIPLEDAALRAGGWQETAGITLAGRTLGLVGLGRLGRRVAGYGQAFGMTVQAWSSNLTAEQAAACGVTAVSKDALFRTSDVISLHLVLGERSRGVVGAAEIAAMPRGAILVNTARAGLVDEPAMIAALEEGRIQAGIDVFPDEPLASDSVYRGLPNTVLTPHLGYVTADAMRQFHQGTLEVVRAWLDGAPIRLAS